MHHNTIVRLIHAIIVVVIIACFFSCGELARKVGEESGKARRINDSLVNEQNDKPIATDRFDILETKKEGEDSLFLTRQFYLTGEKYTDSWFINRSLRHGISKFYYKSGQLNYSMLYINDTVIELLESYTPNGQKRNNTWLKNGTGHLKLYHPITFELIVDCELKNKHKHGNFSNWYANGNKRARGYFTEDLALRYTEWYISGIVKSDLVRKAGSPNTFTYTTAYASGKPELYHFQQDDMHSTAEKYDERGNVLEKEVQANGHIKNCKCYYSPENILLSRGNYVDEKKQGNYDYFYESGAKKSVEVYANDTIISETEWYASGQLLKTVGYKNNAYNGWYRDYYPNGNKRVEQEYMEGVKHGKYTSYFDNGNKYYEGTFENGKPKGEMKVYSRNKKYKSSKYYN